MPGFLETTIHQGFDYLSPYVEKAQPYVEKVRSNVPLVDPALKKAEVLVPALITRADEFTEPHVVKMRPYVEPRVEQVMEKVAPYVDEGVKKYGVLRDGGVKYYNVGLDKVEQVKGFKDAKETQIREFAEPKVEKIKEFKEARTAQIHEFTDPKLEKIREFKEVRTAQIHDFTDPKIEKIKEFKEARTTQIHEFTDPKVQKIKEFAAPKVEQIKHAMEPQVSIFAARRQEMQKLLRVPASLDVKGLNCETLLGKVASGLENLEAFIDRYEPLTEEQKKDNDSDISNSNASDTSVVRVNRSVVSILSRLLLILMVKIAMLSGLPGQLKASYLDGTLKAKLIKFPACMKWLLDSKGRYAKVAGKRLFFKIQESCQCVLLRIKDMAAPTVEKVTIKVKPLLALINDKVSPRIAALTQTSVFKKVWHMVVLASNMVVLVSNKTLGKERTKTILSKAEKCIPAEWMTVPPPSAGASKPEVKPRHAKKDSRSSEEQAIKQAMADEQRHQPQTTHFRKRTADKGESKGKGNH